MVTNAITVSPRASVKNYWEHYKREFAPDNYVTPDSQFVSDMFKIKTHSSSYKLSFYKYTFFNGIIIKKVSSAFCHLFRNGKLPVIYFYRKCNSGLRQWD